MVLSGCLGRVEAMVLKKTWHLTTLYLLYEQTLVHHGLLTAWFLLTLSDFVEPSALGTNTWAHARVVGAACRGCVPFSATWVLVLEDGGYRRPPKDWCHHSAVSASGSHLETCVGMAISRAWRLDVTAILLTPENRMAMGRRSGLAHVAWLSDIHLECDTLPVGSWRAARSTKDRDVGWSSRGSRANETGEHVEEGRPGPPVCKHHLMRR